MKLTTLCYIENAGRYLMLYRNSKENDPSHGKWIGAGGKFEPDESPEECVMREVREETGFELTDYSFRGIVTFVSDEWETEYMHLFTAQSEYGGEPPVCREGRFEWINKSEIMNLNLWEGDRIFLRKLMESEAFFSLKFVYNGDKLVKVMENGRNTELA